MRTTPKKKAITWRELDSAGCSEAGCQHDHSVLFLHSACHRHAGTFVRYEKLGHLLIIECAYCQKEVVRIALKGETDVEIERLNALQGVATKALKDQDIIIKSFEVLVRNLNSEIAQLHDREGR